MSNQELQTIDPAALAQVSGGAAAPANATASNDQILTALTGILNSIQSLATHQNGGGFNQQEMLMLMMIMQQRNQPVAIAAPAPDPWAAWGGQPIIRYY